MVVGQNFTRELRLRYPQATIDLMLRPRMRDAQDFMEPLSLFNQFLFGEKKDYHLLKGSYDLSYMIDEAIFPEGQLRTVFTRAGFPFRQHKLTLASKPEDDAVAAGIVSHLPRPIIATQDDLARKWPQAKVEELCRKLEGLGTLLVLGPNRILPGFDHPLSFSESAQLLRQENGTTGRRTLLASVSETAALLRQVDLFVGVDSGIAHAAALVGTQTVLMQMVFPEGWIAPTEYANCFIEEEHAKHRSVYPMPDDFCGHYFCLRPTRKGGIKSPSGNPLLVKCVWKKRWGFFKGCSCFRKISVDAFYGVVVDTMRRRGMTR
jgi:hypothetical protein